MRGTKNKGEAGAADGVGVGVEERVLEPIFYKKLILYDPSVKLKCCNL